MTDNRTTELLRKLLEERGIEWRSGLEGVTFVGDWCFVEYENGRLAATCEPVLTSEQAIAATMGNERLAFLEEKVKLQGDYIYKLLKEKDELFAKNCKAATRHAGQMDRMKRELEAATLSGGKLTAEQVRETVEKHWHDLPADYDMPEATALPEFSYDWQAIADELNAVLGSGTCEQVLTDCDDGLMPPFTAHCSACGAEWGFTPKYCYNCGAKCTGTRDERKAVD